MPWPDPSVEGSAHYERARSSGLCSFAPGNTVVGRQTMPITSPTCGTMGATGIWAVRYAHFRKLDQGRTHLGAPKPPSSLTVVKKRYHESETAPICCCLYLDLLLRLKCSVRLLVLAVLG
jgi:hypothetical protein